MTKIRAVSKFFFEGDRKFFIKGATYGPFKPDANGNSFGRPEQVDVDLGMMREIGINTVRVYHAPPDWFLEKCLAAGFRVLITLPWEKHIEFLRQKKVRDKIARMVRNTVGRYVGNPAVLGYLVGNEIASTMARWLGVRRVTEFVEHLVRIGRAVDPDVLYSYATYPPTEYLLPQPLILGEFGMDTIRHSQEEQAEMLGWHIESVAKCGLAGTILFSWTDEWFTGGNEVTDWAFGIVTREREPKKVFSSLRDKFGQDNSTLPHRALSKAPLVSVIVCSYNGARTLNDCLDSLGKLNYPNCEVILVDDGSGGALTRDVSGFSPTAGAGIFSLFHLAAFQTHAGQRHSRARTIAGRRQIGSRIATPGFLERRGTRSSPFARCDFPIARGRRLATMSTFAGACSNRAALSLSVRPRLFGIIAALPYAPF